MRPLSKADDTRARILDAASRLFRQYGYAKTTVVDIARSCRMSAANVYRFFPSKAAITETICQMVLMDLETALRAIAASEASASARITGLIERIVQFASETYFDDRQAYDMVVAAVEENWDTVRQHVRMVNALLAEVIASGIAAGEYPPQDAERSGRCIAFAILGFWHPVAAAQCGGLPDTPEPPEMIAFLLAALNAGQAPIRSPRGLQEG